MHPTTVPSLNWSQSCDGEERCGSRDSFRPILLFLEAFLLMKVLKDVGKGVAEGETNGYIFKVDLEQPEAAQYITTSARVYEGREWVLVWLPVHEVLQKMFGEGGGGWSYRSGEVGAKSQQDTTMLCTIRTWSSTCSWKRGWKRSTVPYALI